MNSYKTLLKSASDESIVQKSRFISYASPVKTQEEALAFLENIRQKHRDARHHCYAYIIGRNAGIMRYSDDGEPGGTAGMPIIEVMKARKVVDAAVVVTRYFGGVLLGAGGLVRAYSHACATALNAAGVCEMHPTQRWLFEVAYPLWDKVQYGLKNQPICMESTEFSTAVTFGLLVRSQDSEALQQELTAITDGQLTTLMTDELFHPWEDAPVEVSFDGSV